MSRVLHLSHFGVLLSGGVVLVFDVLLELEMLYLGLVELSMKRCISRAFLKRDTRSSRGRFCTASGPLSRPDGFSLKWLDTISAQILSSGAFGSDRRESRAVLISLSVPWVCSCSVVG